MICKLLYEPDLMQCEDEMIQVGLEQHLGGMIAEADYRRGELRDVFCWSEVSDLPGVSIHRLMIHVGENWGRLGDQDCKMEEVEMGLNSSAPKSVLYIADS